MPFNNILAIGPGNSPTLKRQTKEKIISTTTLVNSLKYYHIYNMPMVRKREIAN